MPLYRHLSLEIGVIKFSVVVVTGMLVALATSDTVVSTDGLVVEVTTAAGVVSSCASGVVPAGTVVSTTDLVVKKSSCTVVCW